MLLSLILATTILRADLYEGLMFIDVRVNGGRPAAFIIDTAVPTTMIDRRITKRTSADLDVGGLRFHASGIKIDDFSYFKASSGRQVDGILGMDFLMRYTAEFD